MVPGQPFRIRYREAADIESCVEALAIVHQTSGYPTNWPADPARWLTPTGTLTAWIATADAMPAAGHVLVRKSPAGAANRPAAELARLFVIPAARRHGVALALLNEAMRWAAATEIDLVLQVADHLSAAIALYERTGFRLGETTRADWTTPEGQPVTLHQYIWSNTAAP